MDEVTVFIRGNSQRRLIAEGAPSSWGMSYSLVKGLGSCIGTPTIEDIINLYVARGKVPRYQEGER